MSRAVAWECSNNTVRLFAAGAYSPSKALKALARQVAEVEATEVDDPPTYEVTLHYDGVDGTYTGTIYVIY